MSEGSQIIHHRGQPIMLLEKGRERLCTPVVIETTYHCGLGIIHEDGTGYVWGPASPRDLIAAWRGSEILRHMASIGSSTLSDAYYAGLRNPHASDREQVDRVIAQIGAATHRRIMREQVPDDIVSAIVEGQDREMKPDLFPITEEVRAGTLKWRAEFETIGVRHPDEEDRERRERKEVIRQHGSLLRSFAQSAGMPRKCMGMGSVEGALVTLVITKGMVAPKPWAVALSGLAGGVASAQFAAYFMLDRLSQDQYDRLMDRQKREAARKAAAWLRGQLGRRFWVFSVATKTASRYEKELIELFDRYFPPVKEE